VKRFQSYSLSCKANATVAVLDKNM
jgi:hypothetical protein